MEKGSVQAEASGVCEGMHDVVVVGGGPAGAVAAYQLASSGLCVTVIDRQRMPRYKVCGGGVVFRARKMLPFDISACVERECGSARIRLLSHGLDFSATRDQAIISMVMRADFDHLLLTQAEHAGARLMLGQTVRALTQSEDAVRIETPDHVLSARFVIGADGAGSAVARLGGWRETRLLAPALECELQAEVGDMAVCGACASFDVDVIPGGYGWVFPKREHLSIGVVAMRPGRRNRLLKPILTTYLDRLGLRAGEDSPVHGYVIPVSRRKDVARGRIMLTGDAAGLVDPVTGEGITSAISSGMLAAQAIVDAQLDADAAVARYQSLIDDRIGGELDAGLKLARLLYASD
ncbi:MAG: NAD(P)/FAD-dependent oxidoreductase, partial [Mariprofundaceae bacterium]